MSTHRSTPHLAAALLAAAVLCFAQPAAAQEASEEPQASTQVEVQVPDAEPTRTTVEVERMKLPSAPGSAEIPYTISVPSDWTVHRPVGAPGMYLGPPDAELGKTPEMLLVRESDVDASDPQAILENVRANAEQGEWTLVEGEVRDFGGVKGLWLVRRVPGGEGGGLERYNLAVKLPFQEGSVDVVASIPTALYAGRLEVMVKYLLGSLRPVGGDGAE